MQPSMSDPSEATQANLHPVSGHRTPREIAADEAGPIGQGDGDVVPKEALAEKASRPPAARPSRHDTEPRRRPKRG
jgi:hypothetical protein